MSQPKPTDKAKTRGDSEKMGTVSGAGGGPADLTVVLERLMGLEESYKNLRELRQADAAYHDKHEGNMSKILAFMEDTRREGLKDRRELQIARHQLAVSLERNRRLEHRVNGIENQLRECNLRVDGKAEANNEDLLKFVLELGAKLGIMNPTRDEIMSIQRMGKVQQQQQQRGPARNVNRPRTIMVKFVNVYARNKYLFARSALKRVEDFRGIFLNDDVTAMTKRLRDDYRSVATLARDAGEQVRMHSDGVIINGHKYLLTEPHMLPQKYMLANAKTVKTGGELYFHSEHSFLSNFAPSPITEGQDTYLTGEHLYQTYKCKHADDHDRVRQIVLATTPLEAKRIADGITETQSWKDIRDEMMANVVSMKFDQNKDLAMLLKETGDLPLNEATRNMHFGIGVGLHGHEIKDKAYQGANALGRMLVAKRIGMNVATNDRAAQD